MAMPSENWEQLRTVETSQERRTLPLTRAA
jgi:hypothetical protein